MDPALIAATFAAASAGQFQSSVGESMLNINLNSTRQLVGLIDSAQQNIDSLANVLAGVGGNVNISV